MSYYENLVEYKNFDWRAFFDNVTNEDIERIISKDRLNEFDFMSLLSEKAGYHLEAMAQRAKQLTLQHFGKVIFLFTPMYLGNFCVNHCIYCGFNVSNNIVRKKLSLEDVDREARTVAATGLRHVLILTGESRQQTSVQYLCDCVQILKKYFSSISIEVYPLETPEYVQLIDAGVDGMTVFQEVYNEDIYKELHLKGPKRDFHYRLEAPERACKASMRSVNIGALLGLEDWRKESFFTGLHANYLQNKYMDTEVHVSLPRMRPHVGSFQPKMEVNDRSLVQILMALRLFMPRVGITISTRERAAFRDNLIGLGVTKISAGVTTEVGGHTAEKKSDGQFEISDGRSVEEIKNMLYAKGYQPVFKDWQII